MKRVILFVIIICMFLQMMPSATIDARAETVAGDAGHNALAHVTVTGIDLSGLTCEKFLSNESHRDYIEMMLKYYINTNSNIQTALLNGQSAIFMFEGGSDYYKPAENEASNYDNTLSDIRKQSTVIVVQVKNKVASIKFYSEFCSSIPSDPQFAILVDGIYTVKTHNHQDLYGALQIVQNGKQCIKAPDSNKEGVWVEAEGINIHTRASLTAGGTYADGTEWYWSEGCQLIGSGENTENIFNKFMKDVTGIDYNVWVDYTANPQKFNKLKTTGETVGYYVIDRQLALDGLTELYSDAALAKITKASTEAHEAALAAYSSSLLADETVTGIDLSGLTCEKFLSNEDHRSYIEMMLKYYINANPEIQTALLDGQSAIFMFEGGSDWYNPEDPERSIDNYTDALRDIRRQAVVIVVQVKDKVASIKFRSEYCSSIPGDPKFSIQVDGIYQVQTHNHQGIYGALQIIQNGKQCIQAPDSNKDGYWVEAEGMNIHTRSSHYAGGEYANGSKWYWSEGCQLIGNKGTKTNVFNKFMKVVAGIDYNVWIDYDAKTFKTIKAGKKVGYYIIDRQLALDGLTALYNNTALGKITKASTKAHEEALAAYTFSYLDVCDFYPAHCTIKATADTASMTLPCSTGTNSESAVVESVKKGSTYTAVALVLNDQGNYWYQVETSDGKTAYLPSGKMDYVKDLQTDITISGATAPKEHAQGNTFSLEGEISASYNQLTEISAYVYSGTDTSGTPVTGGAESISDNSYSLEGSAVDKQVKFAELRPGTYTYAVYASYQNYYADTEKTHGSNEGKVCLFTATFTVPGLTGEAYLDRCTIYPAHCTIKATADTASMTLPCSTGTNSESAVVESVKKGSTYTAVALVLNDQGNYWYQVEAADGKTAYLPSGKMDYTGDLQTDITISGVTAPDEYAQGNTFPLEGVINSSYNKLTEISAYVYSGIGISGTPVTGGAESTSDNSYSLKGSAVDKQVKFATLPPGTYTYAVYASYENYYADTETSRTANTGRICLCSFAFTVTGEADVCVHSYESQVTTAPTCEEDGLRTYICKNCGDSYSEVIKATGHAYHGEITTEPTCEEDGLRTYTCSNCGDSYTETVSAYGHDYIIWTVEPTCWQDGYTEYWCTRCGGGYISDHVASPGHIYTCEQTDPTCTEEGLAVYTCAYCSESYSESIPALGHVYADGECIRCGMVEDGGVASRIPGDVNGDGQVNTRDAKLIMQFELGMLTETLDLYAADVNGDGEVNTRDAKIIMQYELGISSGNSLLDIGVLKYFGKTPDELIAELGTDYVADFFEGGFYYYYEECNAGFFWTSYDDDPVTDETFATGTVHLILVNQGAACGYGLSAGMTYPQIQELLAPYIPDLEEPEYWYFEMYERYCYSLSFAFNGFTFYYEWTEDPYQNEPCLVTIAPRQSSQP